MAGRRDQAVGGGAIAWAVEDLIRVGLVMLVEGDLRPTVAARHLHLIASV